MQKLKGNSLFRVSFKVTANGTAALQNGGL